MIKSLFILEIIIAAFIPQGEKELEPQKVWSNEQLEIANTAKDADYLSKEEKEVILYLNLARLYPKEYIQLELKKENFEYEIDDDPFYYKSLLVHLDSMMPSGLFYPNKELTETADCFSAELAKTGKVSHNRKYCEEDYGAECISFGLLDPQEVVTQLLVDHGVKSLGHRIVCLSKRYSKIGVSFNKHKKFNQCVVLDFKR